jgi:hypothetical protein
MHNWLSKIDYGDLPSVLTLQNLTHYVLSLTAALVSGRVLTIWSKKQTGDLKLNQFKSPAVFFLDQIGKTHPDTRVAVDDNT